MRWLKGIFVFAGLKLLELFVLALVLLAVYLFFTLTPSMVLIGLFITLFMAAFSYLIILSEPSLVRLYWNDGPLMKIVGIITVTFGLPVIVSAVAKVSFYIGEFYNWVASLIGFTLIKPTPQWVDFSVTGFTVTLLLFFAFIIGYFWICSNIDKTKEILDKWENK